MKQRDVLMLIDGIAPSLVALFGKALAPALERLAATEKKLAAAEAALAERPDVEAVVAEAVRKAIGEQPAAPTVEEIVAALPKPPTAEEVAALVPPAEAGKSVTLDDVRPLVAEAFAAAPPVPTAEEVAAMVPVAQVDPEAVKAAVAEAMAALPAVPTAEEVAAFVPAPAPGKDADPETIKAAVAEEVARQIADLPPPAAPAEPDLEAVAADVTRRLEGAIKTEIATTVAALPQAPKAEDVAALVKMPTAEEVAALVPPAEPGAPGLDGSSVSVDDVRPLIEEAVAKAVAEIPAPKDGVGLAGALIDRVGNLVLTLTDGATKSLGLVIGKDGAPGRDAFGLDDFEVIDGHEAFTLRFVRGDAVKEFTLAKPTLADHYRGVWKQGPHKAGSIVTWGGSIWLAKRDTEDRPESSDAWSLIVKKGRDGRDGEAPKGPAKVKL